jgi:hypothetical protein
MIDHFLGTPFICLNNFPMSDQRFCVWPDSVSTMLEDTHHQGNNEYHMLWQFNTDNDMEGNHFQ